MRFDPRAARLLKAGDHLTVPDAPGLRLVRSTVGWAWAYRYKSPLDGRMRQIKLGTWPELSAAAAGVAWEQLRAQRDAGADPAAQRRQQRQQDRAQALAQRDQARQGPYTVQRLLADYVASAQRAPKGMTELARTLRDAAPIHQLQPHQVTRSVAFDLISAKRGTPVQAASLRRELGAAWDWGHDSGRLADDVPNWWRQILRGRLPSAGKIIGGKHQGAPVKRVLTLEEVGAVIRFLPHTTRLVSDLLTLYLWTACRGAELVQMEAAEVAEEPDGWWWTIPRAKTKMARHPLAVDLRVPLIGRALQVVRTRLEVTPTGYLFPPASGDALHSDQKVVGVAIHWHRPTCTLRKESQRPRWPIAHWSAHDLRRTVRTHLAALGCPDAVAEAVLGHITGGVAGVYNRHQYDAERRHWLAAIDQRWELAAAR